MADAVDIDSLREFMRTLGARSSGSGSVYVTGGGTAVLYGWRPTTIDVDIRMDPEPAGAFEAIPAIKQSLHLNVELASPQDFLPPLPGWRERSRHIAREGAIDFFHYDFVSQALSKLERGHHKDLRDVESMLNDGLVTEEAIREGFRAIRDEMIRYPSVSPDALQTKIDEFFEGRDD